jgi:hypothetical protein
VNKTVPSPTNWPEKKPAAKPGGLRAIDQGTGYDVSGRLRRRVREIESGKYGRITDSVLLLRSIKDGEVIFTEFCNGLGTQETYFYMAHWALKKHLPERADS